MPTSRRVLIASLLLAACGGSTTTTMPGPATPATGTTEAAVTVPDLRHRLGIVADDSMMGREAGTRGNVMGTAYIAAELARLGVEPAGENGTYFQEVPLVSRGLRPDAFLRGGARTLKAGEDYAFLAGIGNLPVATHAEFSDIQVIYAGRVGDTVSAVTPEQAAGKLVILGAMRNPDGSRRFQIDPRALMRYADARAVAFANLDVAADPLRDFLSQPQVVMDDDAEPDAASEGPALLFVTQDAATVLLGRDAATALPGVTGGPVSALLGRADVPVAHPARNVVGIVRGSDPALRNTYVAIGAHNDHVGMAATPVMHDSVWAYNRVIRPMGAEDERRDPTAPEAARMQAIRDSLRALRPDRPDSVFNGADDDGSGTVAVLELAEEFARASRKPARSLLFVWHTGEEKGLYGSDWYTRHPTVPRDSIVAALNIDMIGRGMATDLSGGGPGYVQLIGSRRLSTELGSLVERVNTDGRHGFTFDYQFDAEGHPQQYYCRSDHYMYARYGIPVVFFTTGAHPDYHMLTDEIDMISFEKLQSVTRLIGDLATHVANLDHRPVVDGVVMGPDEECEQ